MTFINMPGEESYSKETSKFYYSLYEMIPFYRSWRIGLGQCVVVRYLGLVGFGSIEYQKRIIAENGSQLLEMHFA